VKRWRRHTSIEYAMRAWSGGAAPGSRTRVVKCRVGISVFW
jgi:hypothetical protein